MKGTPLRSTVGLRRCCKGNLRSRKGTFTPREETPNVLQSRATETRSKAAPPGGSTSQKSQFPDAGFVQTPNALTHTPSIRVRGTDNRKDLFEESKEHERPLCLALNASVSLSVSLP